MWLKGQRGMLMFVFERKKLRESGPGSLQGKKGGAEIAGGKRLLFTERKNAMPNRAGISEFTTASERTHMRRLSGGKRKNCRQSFSNRRAAGQ
jgi:hypothetical protein